MLVNIHFSQNTVWHRSNKVFELGLNPNLAIWCDLRLLQLFFLFCKIRILSPTPTELF